MNLVRNILPAVVLPQVGMLFYAIYLRIAQYDFTINRYFVVVFGLWLVGISLYFLISREKRLIMITASLAVITLLISVGPWSVYHLPLARQYSRLVANLETAGILSNGQIKPLATYESIDVTLSDDIYTGIEYVCGFDHCRLVRALFEPSLPTLVQAENDREKNWEKDALEYQKCQTLGQFDCYRKVMDKEMSSWEIREHIASIIKVRVKPYQ